MPTITLGIDTRNANGRSLVVPTGITTPHQSLESMIAEGAAMHLVHEGGSGQAAAVLVPNGEEPITVRYGYVEKRGGLYPEELFVQRVNRYTRAADALVGSARRLANKAGDPESAIHAIVNETASRFVYGHPEAKFYDGHETIPHLSCGLTQGSCVDINTYLVAALRGAGFDAGYVAGYFFPAEKLGNANDMHCWVVTRHDGTTREWDIAHHLKMGTNDIRPGLNPKPGFRVALSHSMGLDFPAAGVRNLKVLAEAQWINPDGTTEWADVAIRSDCYDLRDRNTADHSVAPGDRHVHQHA